MKVTTKKEYRDRRHLRLRQKIAGTADRPRLSVFVSNLHFYAQFIDDQAGRTLAMVSTRDGAAETAAKSNNAATAQALGTRAAQAAQAKGIRAVVFDRGGFAYRGRIKAFAEAARAAGLAF